MISREELQNAINECEALPASYQNCEKLATFYTIFNHLYSKDERLGPVEEVLVGDYGDSEFFKKVKGKSAQEVWRSINELLDALQALNPGLYYSFMSKL